MTDTLPDRIALDELALLLDIDGTLLDFAPTPREVSVPPSLRKDLETLHGMTGGALALVSGRAIADLDLLFAPLALPAVGGHGAEMRVARDGAVAPSGAASLDLRLKRELAAVAELGPGILIEDKGYSLALHYRLAPDMGDAVRDAVAAICSRFPELPIVVLPGKSVVEVKLTGFDKATGVARLLKVAPFAGRRPVFLGDDVTDECVFPTLAAHGGFGFAVGRHIDTAEGYFSGPAAVREWLGTLPAAGGIDRPKTTAAPAESV